ncbi:MAG: 3-dehydroquinate synthase [Chloroflexi bacterium]|nr:3-dehydroquinate synthase [Chloroflexota bacterium]
MPERPQRIVLTGFSGSGKSVVAPLVAGPLGWRAVGTDPLVEKAAGKSIPEIFRDDGEERFRDLESEVVAEVCREERVVIALGGGALLRPENRRICAKGSFVVCLEARPETLFRRLDARALKEALDRPLLAISDPLARIRELKAARQHLYALCDWTVQTDALTREQVAEEVLRAWRELGGKVSADPNRFEEITAPYAAAPSGTLHAIPPGAASVVRTESGEYPVFVSWGALPELGTRLREAKLTGRALVISDDAVFARYGGPVEQAIRSADIAVASHVVPAGEGSKTLETAAAIYDWLVGQRAERGQAVVALGGGMITDLGGYVAATFARGLPLVQAPTSLLAMVDAAIGGKVAVNHREAKNLIGAFYQPRLVLADVSTLKSLPPRERAAGWAEVIKHAFIADEELLALLETRADGVLALEPEVTTEVIRRSIAVKASVVSEDEREETGRRMVLNYGHTVGHALEAATEYGRFLHGEAVAIGMTAAAEIGRGLRLVDEGLVERQRRLLARFGLPVTAGEVDRDRVRAAMSLDKKVRGGAVRWVLLDGVGRPVLRDDVPARLVEQALAAVLT